MSREMAAHVNRENGTRTGIRFFAAGGILLLALASGHGKAAAAPCAAAGDSAKCAPATHQPTQAPAATPPTGATTPTIEVRAQLRTVYVSSHHTWLPRLVLSVKGTGFAPGGKVSIAVVDT